MVHHPNAAVIDATNECIKVTNNNKLTEDNIQRIVDVFTTREDPAGANLGSLINSGLSSPSHFIE